MGLNKQKGNMYPFVTHTWNPIRGKCPHDCVYCYMKGFPAGEYRLVSTELKTDLGQGNFIFVGSSTDGWVYPLARTEWILVILNHCRRYPLNRYLFQSKAPQRFSDELLEFPPDTVLGTTIETNRLYDYTISKAPPVGHRVAWMKELKLPKMVSIEPIMDFDPEILVDWIKQIAPEFVSVGADSKGHNLPEPSPPKINTLIEGLQSFTRVYTKNNLKRLSESQSV